MWQPTFHIQNNSHNGWWWPRLYHPSWAKMFTYLRPTTVNSGLLWAPTDVGTSVIIFFSTNVNCHQSSYWTLFGNRSLFIPMFFILPCIVLRACPLSCPVSLSSVCRSPCVAIFFGQPGSVSKFPPLLWVKLWVGWVGRGYTEISRYFPASWINWITLVTKIKLLYSWRF